jgi:hypothetical protein
LFPLFKTTDNKKRLLSPPKGRKDEPLGNPGREVGCGEDAVEGFLFRFYLFCFVVAFNLLLL